MSYIGMKPSKRDDEEPVWRKDCDGDWVNVNMDNTLKYLKVTVYDNDFTYPLLKAVKILYDICYENSNYPDETDIENVKNYLNHLCFTIKQIDDHFEWGETTDESLHKYLIPDVYIVSSCDIPDWDNAESVFMPLFDTEEEVFFR